MTQEHEIVLKIPADPEFVRVARVTASGLASRLHFSIDDVDDLRLALDELCHILVEKAPQGAELELRYQMFERGLVVTGTAPEPSEPSAKSEAVMALSKQILTALVDDHSVWSDESGRHFSLTKHSAAALR